MIIDSLTFSADLGKSHYDEVFEFDSDSASALQLFSLDRINSLSELALDRYEDILDLVKVLSEADRSEEATTLSAHLAKSLAYATGKVTVYFHDSEDATHRMIEVSNYRDNIYPQVKNFLTSNLPPHVEAMKIFLEMNDSFLDSLDEVAPIDSVDDSDDGLELPS